MIALLLVLLLISPAAALTPGGGSPATDCLAEYGGTLANHPPTKPKEIRCIDNDSSCDDDPTPGRCQFRVSVCLNVTDPQCTPQDLEDYFVENEQPDTNPMHDFDFQTLQDTMNNVALPVDSTDHDFCSSEVAMTVPLPIRLSNGGGKYRRGRKTLKTRVSGPGGVLDEDRLKLSCTAPDGATPCDDLTSTFEQIQRVIFPTCARSTCHNVAQGLHQLSLDPADAYASLVGVAANNPVAAAAGKLRVDPGNPGNSFILDKLRGTLAAGEGERMPRGLKKLKSLEIELVEEWIAAGAPETGFVAPVGCH